MARATLVFSARTLFTVDEVAARSNSLNSSRRTACSSLVRGASRANGPRFCSPRRDGLLYLDHILPDPDAVRHWLVKFGRGPNPALADILRQEAPYMRLARYLGLRVHGKLDLRHRALFVPRFDRVVTKQGVRRVAQESLASLCELAEFGAAPTHNVALARLAQASTSSEEEVIEYVKRDVANVVLGNKDNHGRNTAIQRFEDGTLRLAPVYEFAPMLPHPDGIARCMRWARDDGGLPRWSSVVDQCHEATQLPPMGLPTALREMGVLVANLRARSVSEGIDADLVTRLAPFMDDVGQQLRAL